MLINRKQTGFIHDKKGKKSSSQKNKCKRKAHGNVERIVYHFVEDVLHVHQ